jgi:hypothetical protein
VYVCVAHPFILLQRHPYAESLLFHCRCRERSPAVAQDLLVAKPVPLVQANNDIVVTCDDWEAQYIGRKVFTQWLMDFSYGQTSPASPSERWRSCHCEWLGGTVYWKRSTYTVAYGIFIWPNQSALVLIQAALDVVQTNNDVVVICVWLGGTVLENKYSHHGFFIRPMLVLYNSSPVREA